MKHRDDKSYPWLAVTRGDEFLRVNGRSWRQAQAVRITVAGDWVSIA